MCCMCIFFFFFLVYYYFFFLGRSSPTAHRVPPMIMVITDARSTHSSSLNMEDSNFKRKKERTKLFVLFCFCLPPMDASSLVLTWFYVYPVWCCCLLWDNQNFTKIIFYFIFTVVLEENGPRQSVVSSHARLLSLKKKIFLWMITELKLLILICWIVPTSTIRIT